MDKALRRRKNYFINKRLQLKLTLSVVLTLLAVMLATGIGVYMGMWSSIVENFSSFKVSQNLENAERLADYERARYGRGDHRLDKIFRQAELLSAQERAALGKALKSVNRSFIPKIAFLVILVFLGGIFLSHRIAGPIYRFEKSAEAMKRGELGASFRIRKSDELQEVSTALEGMARGLGRDMKNIKSGVARLREDINSLQGGIDPVRESAIKSALANIEKVLSKYNI